MASTLLEIPTFVIDAFTSKPFGGNPAGVCLLRAPLPEDTMKRVAAELNLPATAFVVAEPANTLGEVRAALRWFTPQVELPLCGHATLGAAAVLLSDRGARASQIRFQTARGELLAKPDGDAVALDFPANPSEGVPSTPGILSALGVSRPKNVEYSPGARKLLVEVADEAAVRRVQPDFGALLEARDRDDVKGVMVTARGHDGIDFVSRYFNPWNGIPEDAATGSSHTVLCPYWAARLGKRELVAYQASSRGGDMRVRLRDDGRVDLIGEAVIALRGTLRVPD